MQQETPSLTVAPKLQAPVYHILPPTTAIIYYTTRLEKLPADGQFSVGAQMAVSLYKTTQIMSGVSFVAILIAYASTDKTRIF